MVFSLDSETSVTKIHIGSGYIGRRRVGLYLKTTLASASPPPHLKPLIRAYTSRSAPHSRSTLSSPRPRPRLGVSLSLALVTSASTSSCRRDEDGSFGSDFVSNLQLGATWRTRSDEVTSVPRIHLGLKDPPRPHAVGVGVGLTLWALASASPFGVGVGLTIRRRRRPHHSASASASASLFGIGKGMSKQQKTNVPKK